MSHPLATTESRAKHIAVYDGICSAIEAYKVRTIPAELPHMKVVFQAQGRL